MARFGSFDVPDDLLQFALAAHGGHGAAAPSSAAPLSPGDVAAFEDAQAQDRKAASLGALAQNLSRSAAMYRGEKAGPLSIPVPQEVKDFVQRRQMVQAPNPDDDPASPASAAARAALRATPQGKTMSDAMGSEFDKLSASKLKPFVPQYRAMIADPEEGKRKDRDREDEQEFRAGEAEKDRASRERAAKLSAGQRDRSLDIAEDNAAARREAADAKRRMVSDAQVKAIADYDRGIRILEDLVREKPQIDTGPAANARNAIAQKLGIDDPQVSSYKAQVNDFLAQYIRSISGAATTDKERVFLLQNMPKLADSDEVFTAKAQKTMKRLRELRALEIDLIKRQGKDVSEFEGSPITERGPGMPAPAETSGGPRGASGASAVIERRRTKDGRVLVKYADGRIAEEGT